MSEYINKAELWKKMTQRYDEVTDFLEIIDDVPAIDIVRCSECEHRVGQVCTGGCFGKKTRDDWFCADGERKE